MLVMVQMFHSKLVKWSMITSMNFSGKNLSDFFDLQEIFQRFKARTQGPPGLKHPLGLRGLLGLRSLLGLEKKTYDKVLNSVYSDMKVV